MSQNTGQNRRCVLAVDDKTGTFLPYGRFCETFRDLCERTMSTATLAKAISAFYQNPPEVEEKIRTLLVDAQVLYVVTWTTGMWVNGIRQWLHIASTGLLTAYGHHRKRGSQAMNKLQILPLFHGTMNHDFRTPYFRYPDRHALGNAHTCSNLLIV